MGDVLDLGPGLTLDTPQVQTWLDRVTRNLQRELTKEQLEAEIRITRAIAATPLSAPDVQGLAGLAADPVRNDQFTGIRSVLERNYVLLAGSTALRWMTQGVVGHLGVEAARWLSANAADILIAARGWGAPYLAWIAPILDRAPLMLAAAQQAAAARGDQD